VITFALGEPGEPDGEIYISADTARAQAKEYGVPLRQEIARLAIHGVLHLCGHDDGTEAEAARMHALQEKLLLAWQSRSSAHG
jgi:probable rRNA maturation factor